MKQNITLYTSTYTCKEIKQNVWMEPLQWKQYQDITL